MCDNWDIHLLAKEAQERGLNTDGFTTEEEYIDALKEDDYRTALKEKYENMTRDELVDLCDSRGIDYINRSKPDLIKALTLSDKEEEEE